MARGTDEVVEGRARHPGPTGRKSPLRDDPHHAQRGRFAVPSASRGTHRPSSASSASLAHRGTPLTARTMHIPRLNRYGFVACIRAASHPAESKRARWSRFYASATWHWYVTHTPPLCERKGHPSHASDSRPRACAVHPGEMSWHCRSGRPARHRTSDGPAEPAWRRNGCEYALPPLVRPEQAPVEVAGTDLAGQVDISRDRVAGFGREDALGGLDSAKSPDASSIRKVRT